VDPRAGGPLAGDPHGVSSHGVDPHRIDPHRVNRHGADPHYADTRGVDPCGVNARAVGSLGVDPRAGGAYGEASQTIASYAPPPRAATRGTTPPTGSEPDEALRNATSYAAPHSAPVPGEAPGGIGSYDSASYAPDPHADALYGEVPDGAASHGATSYVADPYPADPYPADSYVAASRGEVAYGVASRAGDPAAVGSSFAADAPSVGSDFGDSADHSSDEGDDVEVVGRTGARFGPYSVRKPRRAKEFDTGSTPVVEDPVVTPPLGEPTPEQSAERTVPLVRPWTGALVRPYAHTGGRTRSSHVLALEALVSSRWRPGVGDAVLTTSHRRMIVELCARPRSVAEVAALLSVPLGVVRVLLGDLATAGVVVVHPTAGTSGDGAPGLDFMRRVLVGLRNL
jgi:hypothetical protein